MCPKGDDPLTPSTGYRQVGMRIRYRLAGGIATAGLIQFSFNGMYTTLYANATEAECLTAVLKLRNIKSASCRFSTVAGDTRGYDAVFIVTILSYPAIPMDTNYYSHDGSPPISSFGCKGLKQTELGDVAGSECLAGDHDDPGVIIPGMIYIYCHCLWFS